MEHADLVTTRSSTVTLPSRSSTFNSKRRPASAVVTGSRSNGRDRKKIDAKYIADASKFLVLLEEHEAEEEEKRRRKMRPQSAPVYKTNKR